MEQHTIGAPYSDSVVQVYQVANRVWIADGEALGDQLRVRGSTAKRAARAVHMSAFGVRADIAFCGANVRF